MACDYRRFAEARQDARGKGRRRKAEGGFIGSQETNVGAVGQVANLPGQIGNLPHDINFPETR